MSPPIPIFGSLTVYLTLEALASAPSVTMLGASLLVKVIEIVLQSLPALQKRLQGPNGGAKGPDINPAAVMIFGLLALVFLVKAFG